MYKYTEEELEYALEEWHESCIRTGLYDIEEMAEEFISENPHMRLDITEIIGRLQDIDSYLG